MFTAAIAHHTGITLTGWGLQHFGFDKNETCQIAARNVWCGFFCTFFTWCGINSIFFEASVRPLQHALIGYIISDSVLIIRQPQFNTYENWCHHGLTSVLVGYSMMDSQRHYDLIHLGGIGEFSTIFYAVVDTFKHVPWLKKRYPDLNTAMRTLFLSLFVLLRVGWWTYVIVFATKVPPYLFVSFCFYGILVLQYYWFYLILRWIRKKMFLLYKQ